MNAIIKKPIIVLEDKGFHEREEALLVEEPLEIRINGAPYAVIMRTPGSEMELAAGFCFTEGLVDSFSEIQTIGFCKDAPEGLQNIVNVIVAQKACGRADADAAAPARAVRKMASRSSCGLCGVEMLGDVEKSITAIESGLRLMPADIFTLPEKMFEQQSMFSRTRASHAAALFRANGELVVLREDVGRHNALDKVIGNALLQGLDCSGCIAMLSSRISFEMVQKALRARIPVIAAVSAATSLAVDLAERNGCTLIGRVRDKSMIIYTRPDRVVS
jgi:FdhD protein